MSRIAVMLAALLPVAVANAQDKATPPPPMTPRSAAQVDVTGYWVSTVTEDWRYRMRTPPKGDQGSVFLNPDGLKVLNEWDPTHDTPEMDRCKAYGAAAIIRRPGRLHIEWQDDATLRVDFDAGSQTRIFHFAGFLPPGGFGTFEAPLALLRFQPPPGPATRQGYSVAAWNKVAQAQGLQIIVRMSTTPAPGQGGGLMVLTTHMMPGYLQKNGVPYSGGTVLTEYFDRIRLPDGTEYLIVTSIVADPAYLDEPYVTSTQFKREPDGSRWAPGPCDPG